MANNKSKDIREGNHKTDENSPSNNKVDSQQDNIAVKKNISSKQDSKIQEEETSKSELPEKSSDLGDQKEDGEQSKAELTDNEKQAKLDIDIEKIKKVIVDKKDELEKYKTFCERHAADSNGKFSDWLLGGNIYGGITNDVKGAIGTDKYASELTSSVFKRLAGTGIGMALISTGFLAWLGAIIIAYCNTSKAVGDSLKKYFTEKTGGIIDFTEIPNPSEALANYADGANKRNENADKFVKNLRDEHQQEINKLIKEAEEKHSQLLKDKAELLNKNSENKDQRESNKKDDTESVTRSSTTVVPLVLGSNTSLLENQQQNKVDTIDPEILNNGDDKSALKSMQSNSPQKTNNKHKTALNSKRISEGDKKSIKSF